MVQRLTLLDPAQLHLCQMYARALLRAAEKAGIVQQVLDEFAALETELLDAVPPLENLLRSPRTPPGTKRKILDRALEGKVSDVLLNFLRVVIQHRRFDWLRLIHRQALALQEEKERTEVEVTAARVLPAELHQQIVWQLERALKCPVRLKVGVNPELIGGLVLRVGDIVYDGSVAGRLARLRQQVIDHTASPIDQAFARHPITEKA